MLVLVGGLIYYLIMMLPIPEPFRLIVKVIAILICILVLVGIFFGGINVPVLRLN